MRLLTLDVAYPNERGTNERDACTFAQTVQLQEDSHGQKSLLLQFHEAVIRNRVWKISLTILLYVVDIKSLQVTISTLMEHNHDGHDFTVRHRKCPVSSLS